MRIIAGKYRSRRIETRSSSETRPTLDKVREAVFSSLGGTFQGGTFLDLYAGSGANGLEGLSRGMDCAVFVDLAKDAVDVIRQNINSLGCQECTEVYHMKDTRALALLKEQGRKFSVIYLDPPYAKQHNAEILSFIDTNEMMAPNGVVVIESDKKDHFEENYTHLKFIFDKEYGISRITYYRYEA
jgi:RNA methyltransferase, RsmD family